MTAEFALRMLRIGEVIGRRQAQSGGSFDWLREGASTHVLAARRRTAARAIRADVPGATLREIALALGVSRVTVHHYLHGRSRDRLKGWRA